MQAAKTSKSKENSSISNTYESHKYMDTYDWPFQDNSSALTPPSTCIPSVVTNQQPQGYIKAKSQFQAYSYKS